MNNSQTEDSYILKNKLNWYLSDIENDYHLTARDMTQALKMSLVEAKKNIELLKKLGHEFIPVRLIK